MITPNIPTPSTNEQIEQTLMIELVNSESGITGSAAFRSLNRKARNVTAETASSDSTRIDDQPYCVAHVNASSSGTTVPMSVAKPSQSSCRVVPRGFMCGNSK